MPELKKTPTDMNALLSDNNYPSSVDKMVGSVDSSQGGEDRMPSMNNPVMGSDGKLATTKYLKTTK